MKFTIMFIYFCVFLTFLSFSSANNNPSKLKALPTCQINEVLNVCPAYCTFEKTCMGVILGSVRVCQTPTPPDYVCQPRCDCKTDYVRMGFVCEPVAKCCTGQNEEITNCPAPCDETCSGPPAAGCLLSPCSEKGCRCKIGFVRDSSGACIPKNQCQIECPYPNTEFKSCAKPCEPSCDVRNPICDGDCVSGCFCKEGYIRDSGDNCIPISECPNSCRENERFYECGPCERTCNGGQSCTTGCVSGCFCIEGFVRDSNGRCVRPSECGKNPSESTTSDDAISAKRSNLNVCTGKNQIWRTCYGGCNATCQTPDMFCDGCVDGCYCKDGYVVNQDNECVKKEDCEKCKDPNEVFSECLRSPGKIGHMGCIRGCTCKEGYIYNKEGVCVKNTPQPLCTGENEEYSECARRFPPNARCIKSCFPGCVCKKGFIRKFGACVEDKSY